MELTDLVRTLLISFIFMACVATAKVAWAECKVEPGSGDCLPMATATIPSPHPEYQKPPGLRDLRPDGLMPATPHPERSPTESMPTPGGFGGGVIYKPGYLQATVSADLTTTMFIHPEGLGETTNGLDWLFTTSTNRTQMGVEVVGIYYNGAPYGALGVYDWSCSSTNPCTEPSGQVDYEPHWVWTSDFRNFACDTSQVTDPSGRVRKAIQYSNITRVIKAGGSTAQPPTWVNVVLLLNQCKHRWDQVWVHKYAAVQEDCSTGYACGWWVDTMETYPANNGSPMPEIAELGFMHTQLIHNGNISHLTPIQTSFIGVAQPWILFWLDPNQGYGAGNS